MSYLFEECAVRTAMDHSSMIGTVIVILLFFTVAMIITYLENSKKERKQREEAAYKTYRQSEQYYVDHAAQYGGILKAKRMYRMIQAQKLRKERGW